MGGWVRGDLVGLPERAFLCFREVGRHYPGARVTIPLATQRLMGELLGRLRPDLPSVVLPRRNRTDRGRGPGIRSAGPGTVFCVNLMADAGRRLPGRAVPSLCFAPGFARSTVSPRLSARGAPPPPTSVRRPEGGAPGTCVAPVATR